MPEQKIETRYNIGDHVIPRYHPEVGFQPVAEIHATLYPKGQAVSYSLADPETRRRVAGGPFAEHELLGYSDIPTFLAGKIAPEEEGLANALRLLEETYK